MYYRVKDRYDQKFLSESEVTLIKGELFTAGEVRRYRIPHWSVEAVNIPSRSTYVSFGCRFACE